MRRLTAERLRFEQQGQGISLSAHVRREFNAEADALANMDIVSPSAEFSALDLQLPPTVVANDVAAGVLEARRHQVAEIGKQHLEKT